ncbi:MAG: hypothetical protein KGL95_06760, partial [Patescibacteria group bacterium]|nr:hypothetical protein [Patescibacteria group bacterium]
KASNAQVYEEKRRAARTIETNVARVLLRSFFPSEQDERQAYIHSLVEDFGTPIPQYIMLEQLQELGLHNTIPAIDWNTTVTYYTTGDGIMQLLARGKEHEPGFKSTTRNGVHQTLIRTMEQTRDLLLANGVSADSLPDKKQAFVAKDFNAIPYRQRRSAARDTDSYRETCRRNAELEPPDSRRNLARKAEMLRRQSDDEYMAALVAANHNPERARKISLTLGGTGTTTEEHARSSEKRRQRKQQALKQERIAFPILGIDAEYIPDITVSSGTLGENSYAQYAQTTARYPAKLLHSQLKVALAYLLRNRSLADLARNPYFLYPLYATSEGFNKQYANECYTALVDASDNHEGIPGFLMRSTYRRILTIAQRYSRILPLSTMDLAQEGNIAFIHLLEQTIQKDTPAAYLQNSLSVTVERKMVRAADETGWTIRLPGNIQERYQHIRADIAHWRATHANIPFSLKQFAEDTGRSVEEIEHTLSLINAAKHVDSLERPIDENETLLLGDTISSPVPTVTSPQVLSEEGGLLELAHKILKGDELRALQTRLSLDGGETQSWNDAADTAGLPRTTIRRLYASAIKKLREATEGIN